MSSVNIRPRVLLKTLELESQRDSLREVLPNFSDDVIILTI